MRTILTLTTIGLLALGATSPASAGTMGDGKAKCFPFGCHDR